MPGLPARAHRLLRRKSSDAARLAAEHANTPVVTILDSLGREVVTIAHNRVGPAQCAGRREIRHL